jgi:hypothetical protein
MPLYGTDFDKIIDLKSDNAYSPYFDNTKKNRIIREATNKAISAKIAENDRTAISDDLFGIYKPNTVVTPSSNTVSLILGGSGIADYFQIMNLQVKFVIPLTGNFISQALNTTPLRIELNKASNLRTKEQVLIAGVTTNTNANGTRYVKMITPRRYQLYSDENLLTAISGNGLYNGSSGSISQVIYNYAKPLHSNRKFSVLNEPDVHNPFYEIGNGVLTAYPLSWPSTEFTVDYVSTPTYIDVTDSTTDLLTTYSSRFIDYLADMTCLEMAFSSRDTELANESTAQINQP